MNLPLVNSFISVGVTMQGVITVCVRAVIIKGPTGLVTSSKLETIERHESCDT